MNSIGMLIIGAFVILLVLIKLVITGVCLAIGFRIGHKIMNDMNVQPAV